MSLHLIGLSGSLRAASYNTALLRVAAALAPEGVTLALHDYRDVPVFDEDRVRPASVERLNDAIAAADGVLLAVPEYNHSMPGVLKNALDWASRPAYRSVFRDKPSAVMSASKSLVGGARGQQHAKGILLGMAAPVFAWPELMVPAAQERFDAAGDLTDPVARAALADFLAGFARFARALGGTAARAEGSRAEGSGTTNKPT